VGPGFISLPGMCSIEIQCLKHLTCNHQTVNKIPSLSIEIKGIPPVAHMPCLNHSEEEDNVSLPSRSLRLACWSCLLPGKQALLPSKSSLFIAWYLDLLHPYVKVKRLPWKTCRVLCFFLEMQACAVYNIFLLKIKFFIYMF
jgi:hypothetical protein